MGQQKQRNQTDRPQHGVYIGSKSNPTTWFIYASIQHKLEFLSISCDPQHGKLPFCSAENCTLQKRSSLCSWQCSYWQGLPCQRKACRSGFISALAAKAVCAYPSTSLHSNGKILLHIFLNTVNVQKAWHEATQVLWLNIFPFIYKNSQFVTAYLSPPYWLHPLCTHDTHEGL
jgi:hypothetical protein